MPIENEKKFVLDFSDVIESKFSKRADSLSIIRQGYLQKDKSHTIRIRQQKQENITYHWFTYKNRIDDKITEIEQIISEADFNRLASQSHTWCFKHRYNIEGWDVDFFKQQGKTYFCLAEIELPEDVENPEFIPEFILENLVLTVDIKDRRFSSKKLADPFYAGNLLNQLRNIAV